MVFITLLRYQITSDQINWFIRQILSNYFDYIRENMNLNNIHSLAITSEIYVKTRKTIFLFFIGQF